MRKQSLLFVFLFCIFSCYCSSWTIESEKKLTDDGAWSEPGWSPKGNYFFAINGKRSLVLFDTTGKVVTIKESTQLEHPKWSPDGKLIGCEIDSPTRALSVMNVPDLTAKYIGEGIYDIAWEPKSASLFVYRWKKKPHEVLSGILEFPASGGNGNEVIDLIKDKNALRNFVCNPDSQHVAFTQVVEPGRNRLYNVDTGESEKKLLAEVKGESLSWSPDGKYLWTGAELIDVAAKEVKSDKMPVTGNVQWTADGKKIYYSKETIKDNAVMDGDIACFDFTTGKEEVLKTKDIHESFASFSPDFSMCIAVDGKDGNLVLIKLH